MSFNLSRLTPAPWSVNRHNGTDFGIFGPRSEVARVVSFYTDIDSEFIALARNAFDVLMRRGWIVYRDLNGHWIVGMEAQLPPGVVRDLPEFLDPFSALVATDAWWAANVEKTKEPKA